VSKSFNLALAQMLVTPGDVGGNLSRAEERIATAAGQGADIVLLPESMDCGWAHPSARESAGEIPDGDACRQLRAAAKQSGVFVCAGLAEREARSTKHGTRFFNSAVLIDPRGEVILHHRKINELDFARELYSVGDRLGVAETPWGRAGLMICADAFAPGQAISRSLALMGARFILSPCAWAVPADHDNEREPYGQLWRDNYGPVVREFGVWIAGCSNVGPITAGEWAGRKCIGNSLVCAPQKLVAALGAYGESADEIVMVRVELA
jgi:predicted amidohydrolase